MDILNFITQNQYLIGGVITGLLGIFGVTNNFNASKISAIKEAEVYKNNLLINNDNLTPQDIEKKVKEKALYLFYDKFLTRLIPAWLIGFFPFFSKEAVSNLLEIEYQKLKQIGLNKINIALDNIK